MTDKGKHIGSFLPAQLMREMRQHQSGAQQWQQAWQQAVESGLADKAEPADYSDGVLTIKAISSTWASRLRLQADDLLQRLRQTDDFRELKTLHIKVRPASYISDTRTDIREDSVKYERKSRRLSRQAAEAIEAAAEAIEDPELKEALQRLGKRDL